MNNQKTKSVFYKETVSKMTLERLCEFISDNNLRVIVCKSNGYSHDWEEVEDANIENLSDPNIYLTNKPIGRIFGSSMVSFS
jgi:hypothetical protein